MRGVLGVDLVAKLGTDIAVRCIRRLWLLLELLRLSGRYVWNLRTT
jgi:hypothetical protein